VAIQIREAIISILDNVLQYLSSERFKVLIRRDVDSLVAAIKLVEKLGKNVHIRIIDDTLDWANEDDVICIGFKCGVVSFDWDEIRVGSRIIKVVQSSISFKIYELLKLLNRLNNDDLIDLSIGVAWWETQFCEYLCDIHHQFHVDAGSRPIIALPFMDKGLGYALSRSTLPLLPGVVGVAMDHDDTNDFWDLVLRVASSVYSMGFYPVLVDKLIKYLPSAAVITSAELWEATLSGFNVVKDRDAVEKYVTWIFDAFNSSIKMIESLGGRVAIIRVPKPYLVFKLGPYMMYYRGFNRIVVLYENKSKLHIMAKDNIKINSSGVLYSSSAQGHVYAIFEGVSVSDVVT